MRERDYLPDRKQLRLDNYDYSLPGFYFVTTCTQDRDYLFGEIVDGEMELNNYGLVVERCWLELSDHFDYIAMDEYVVMPNHFHGIIQITDRDEHGAGVSNHGVAGGDEHGAGQRAAPTTKQHGLPTLMRMFKSYSAKHINTLRKTPDGLVWQRSYYDHIIRDDNDLERIRYYIRENPANWESDELFVKG